MDIYKEWKKLEESKFSSPIEEEEIMNAICKESNSVISELKKRLGYKTYWVLLFAVLCGAGLIWTIHKPQAFMIFLVVLIFEISSYLILRFYYRKLGQNFNSEASLLQNIKTNEKNIKSALAFETNSIMLLLPILLIGAVLFNDVYNGLTIWEALKEPRNLTISFIVLAIGFPFVYFFGAKMKKIGFDTHLDRLRKNINQLELLN